MTRVHVEVYGCSANQADAEIASGILTEAGYMVGGEEEAEVTVILTCVVKTPTEVKLIRRIGELTAAGRRLVVAGCMPKAERELVDRIAPEASMVGPDDLSRVAEAVEAAAGGGRVVYLDGTSPDRTTLPRVRGDEIVHIAPISAGCLGNCSYCIVKLARGKLRSFPPEGIVDDAEAAVRSGCREIWVTAEDTAAYDSGGVRLPELLWLLSGIEGSFMIRVGMMTPSSALPILGDLTEAFRGGKIFRFAHIPVQSGSDSVLSRMRRRYTVTEFRDLVEGLRGEVPDIGVATDVICGFPGETDAQFGDSLRLVEWLRPDVLNISRFWPRPGTEAESLSSQYTSRVTKDRSRAMNELWWRVNAEVNARWVGWEGEVIIDKQGHSGFKEGRTDTYKAVVLRTHAKLGDRVRVRVTEAAKGYLIGEES